jgi:hypothetical protein
LGSATLVSVFTFRALSSQSFSGGNPQGDLDGKAHMHLLVNGERLLIPGILHVHLEEGLRIQFDVIADGVADIGGKLTFPSSIRFVARFIGLQKGATSGRTVTLQASRS